MRSSCSPCARCSSSPCNAPVPATPNHRVIHRRAEMLWKVVAIRAIHEWRQGAHDRLLRRHEDEPDAGRVVEELVSGLALDVTLRAGMIAAAEAAERVTAQHVEIAAQQVN